jgi:integrase
VGELLGLRWRDVKWDQNVLLLLPELTKTAEGRDVPITQRLNGVLEMRRHAPDGCEFPPDAFVFGNPVGEPVQSFRTTWENTVLKAHGHEPQRERGKLTGESRKALRAIDLHAHDLRREFACRLRESGAPDHVVAAWLGHANISTTSTYLKTNRTGLQQYLKRFERHRQDCKELAISPVDASADQILETDAKLLN